jgi:spermidine synthase
LGAALGALLAGFYLPALLGFRISYVVAMVINLCVAAVAFPWSATTVCPAPQAAQRAAPSSDLPDRAMWLTAAVSGFAALGLEVLWTRMYAQVLQNSVYTFAIILTVFLISLALGSALANLLCRLRADPRTVLFWLLTGSGLLVGLTPWLFYRLTDGLQVIGADLGWDAYVAQAFLSTAAVLLVPGVVLGSVFP